MSRPAALLPQPNSGNLRWLLLSLALVMGMHVEHLAAWIAILIFGFGLWRYAIDHYGLAFPKLLVLTPITIAATIGIAFTYQGLFGRDASVALLALMLALKLMETKTRRDYSIVIFIAYFLTVNQFLFSQSLLVGAFMLLPILALTTTLIGINQYTQTQHWRSHLRLAGSLILQALPIMLVFFILFPRMPGPLWNVPRDAYSNMTGLSETMEPGSIDQLTRSAATAFRAEFEGKIPAQPQLYWRGPALSLYDGRTWFSSRTPNMPDEPVIANGKPIQYTITLEPHNRHWLLLLDMPDGPLPAESTRTTDGTVISTKPVRTRIRYSNSAVLDYQLAPELSDNARKIALQLPEPNLGNPKTRALAKSWQEQAHTPEEVIKLALSMFHNQEFIYTLRPPLLGSNAVDEFLFNTRRGFCEHYAGSFVFLMRAAGVPARVVTGYQGGELNPAGNYLIVRQSDAHAWAEVWLQGKGWTRVDPTAAVAPERIESGIADAVADNGELPLFSRRDYPVLRKLYLQWDAVNNGWNQWVLGYNQEKQKQLLSYLSGGRLSWSDIIYVLVGTTAILLLALSFWLFRGKRIPRDEVQRIYDRFTTKLLKAGLRRYPHEGPMDFSLRVKKRLPAKTGAIDAITDAYTKLRYAGKISPAAIAAFRKLVSTFRI
jgi:transglutaminase-like putative cysteine protease